MCIRDSCKDQLITEDVGALLGEDPSHEYKQEGVLPSDSNQSFGPDSSSWDDMWSAVYPIPKGWVILQPSCISLTLNCLVYLELDRLWLIQRQIHRDNLFSSCFLVVCFLDDVLRVIGSSRPFGYWKRKLSDSCLASFCFLLKNEKKRKTLYHTTTLSFVYDFVLLSCVCC